MTREEWDREAASFDDEPDHGLRDPATREAWRTLLLGELPGAPARVADLGCGTGTLTRLLADEGYTVDGVDLSPAMLARAREKVPGALFVEGDASRPDLPLAAYAVVLSRHLLWALPDPVAALRAWTALLEPEGRLVLVEGRWHTGAGLTAETTERLVRGVAEEVTVTPLTDAALWGGPIDDERYVVVGHAIRT